MTSRWPGSWIQAMGGFHPSLCPRIVPFFPSPQQSLFQGNSFEREICFWNHFNCTHDWTQLRPLYKHLRSKGTNAEISSFKCPRQVSYVNSLDYQTGHLLISNDLPVSSASPCPSWVAGQFQIYPGKLSCLQVNS